MSAQENTILHIGLSRKDIISCLSEANITPLFLFSQDEITKFIASRDVIQNTISDGIRRLIVLIDPIVGGANDLKKISSSDTLHDINLAIKDGCITKVIV